MTQIDGSIAHMLASADCEMEGGEEGPADLAPGVLIRNVICTTLAVAVGAVSVSNQFHPQTNKRRKKEQQQTPPAFQRWFSVGSFFGR